VWSSFSVSSCPKKIQKFMEFALSSRGIHNKNDWIFLMVIKFLKNLAFIIFKINLGRKNVLPKICLSTSFLCQSTICICCNIYFLLFHLWMRYNFLFLSEQSRIDLDEFWWDIIVGLYLKSSTSSTKSLYFALLITFAFTPLWTTYPEGIFSGRKIQIVFNKNEK